MAGTPRKHRGKLDSKAALNSIVVESQPYYYYGGTSDIIPYGVDNLYPERITESIKQSPTAKGCVKRFREFIFGQGIALGGNIQVNRSGETLNDVLSQSINDYALLNAFALHFNFNMLGQIVEIFNVPIKYIRKHRELNKVDIGVWDTKNQLYTNEFITIDLYGLSNPIEKMVNGGYLGYKGQIMYFANQNQIYSDAVIDGATLSAEYERESQVYPYANIKNSFSANAIVKLPTLTSGEKSSGQVNKLTENLQRLHGAENAGGSVVVPVPIGDNGDPKEIKMVEFLAPTNVDSLFVNQNESAKNNLLKTYTMPEILLGVSSQGMFNQASFNDAFNYKNADTEMDRKIIEREFNKILPASVFAVDSIEIVPLEMKETVQ